MMAADTKNAAPAGTRNGVKVIANGYECGISDSTADRIAAIALDVDPLTADPAALGLLIDLLDDMLPDPDLEPSMGWSNEGRGPERFWAEYTDPLQYATRHGMDLEADDDLEVDDPEVFGVTGRTLWWMEPDDMHVVYEARALLGVIVARVHGVTAHGNVIAFAGVPS